MKRIALIFVLVAAALNGCSSAVGVRAATLAPTVLSVHAALHICARARHRTGPFTLIVAAPHVSVHGFFVRVIGNGYPVVGESGVLYEGRVPTHGIQEQRAPGGGLNVVVPASRVPQGIATGRWVTVLGLLRCYAPMGEVLLVRTWSVRHA